jgi:hypothetical protein
MCKKVLQNIAIVNGSSSYINCLHAILKAADLFDGPAFLLAGLTGMCFKFSIVKGISPISINSYGPWARDHWTAVNHLGIYNSARADRCRHRTFPMLQKKAIEEVVASIDNGLAVLYWGPPFSVIYGYDLTERIFYFVENDDYFQRGRKGRFSLFDNLCLNRSQFWFYQTFGEKIDKSQNEIILDSLKSANSDWNKLASHDTAYGKMAYSLLIKTLESGDFHPLGAALTLDSYATSKKDIFQYMKAVVKVYPELSGTREHFLNVNEIYQTIKAVVGYENKYSTIKPEGINSLIGMLKEAWQYEEMAMREIAGFIEQHAPLRPSDSFRAKWLQGDAR